MEETVEFPFTLKAISLRRVDKFAGPQRYESKEVGFAYASFELHWPGSLSVIKQDDPMAMMAEAMRQLMAWTNTVGMAMGQEVVAQIGLDREEAALDNVPSVDANEL